MALNESSLLLEDQFSGKTNLEEQIAEKAVLNSSRWVIAEDVLGPAIAAFVCLQFALALSANLFIISHTLLQGRRSLAKNSTFLLFSLALVNLLMAVLYMPFYIVSSAAGEWLFGQTDRVRSVLCQIHGFVFVYLMVASIHILAVISIDRFLNIVKPHFHKKFMTWKVSLCILAILWLLDVAVSLAPFYDPILGEYGWSPRVGSCSPLFNGHRLYVLMQSVHSLIPLVIIVVTSLWTFIFTRGFLKRNLKRQKSMLNSNSFVEQKHIYSVQVKNLIGIFGSLLLFNFISWTPFLGISAAGLGIGFRKIPNAVYAASYLLFMFSNVSNPMIQTYFRKDLVVTLKKYFCRWKLASLPCMQNHHQGSGQNSSENSDLTKSPGGHTEARQVRVKDDSGSAMGFDSVMTVLDDFAMDCPPDDVVVAEQSEVEKEDPAAECFESESQDDDAKGSQELGPSRFVMATTTES